jgi:predicted dehydrogenase
MIKAAVVGLGIGMAHCAGYFASPHAGLAAVCDLDPERRKKIGGTFSQGSMEILKPLFDPGLLEKSWEAIGVRATDDLGTILADPDIDVVSLCTPDHTHPRLAVRILEAGKHLLLEKPVALRLEDCPETEAAIRKSGKTVAVGYEFRINPAVRRVKDLVNAGEIGEPEAFSLYHYRTPFRRDKYEKWIQKKDLSGGLIVEETCHWFDLARFVTGREISTLHCVTTDRIHDDFDFEDIAYINGTFEGGGILQISHSLTGFDFSLVMQVHGKKGTIWCALKEEERCSLDGGETTWLGIVVCGPMNGIPRDARVVKFGEEATEPRNIRDYVVYFTEVLAKGGRPLAGYEDGYRALRLSLLAGLSAREARIVGYQEHG